MFRDPNMHGYLRGVILEQKLRFFETYSKNTQILSKRLPFVQAAIREVIPKLYRLRDGDTIETEGYLELKIRDNRILSPSIISLLQDNGIDTTNGFKAYEFYVESSKLPTEILVVASFDFQIESGLPYNLKLIRLGRRKSLELIFYLKDIPEPAILSPHIPETDYPLLTHKQIHRSLTQISSLSMKDKHILDSVISPYIGADWVKRNVYIDGIANSFVSKTQVLADLSKLDDALNSTQYGISLSHHGILNLLNKSPAGIEKMRTLQKFQKFKVVSCNVSSGKNPNNLKQSEFKYATESLNIEDIRDIKNDLALQHTLMYRSLINDKTVSYQLFGSAMMRAIKIVQDWVDKSDKKMIGRIIDENNLDTQIGRIASYFLAITNKLKDEDIIVRKVDTTVNQNIGSIIEKIHLEAELSKRKQDHEREIPLMMRLAFYRSDRTTKGFAEMIMELLGYSEKKSLEYIKQLERDGMIFLSDGVHYHWFSESRFKFKK